MTQCGLPIPLWWQCALAAGLALSGCGGSGGGADAQSPQTSTSVSAAPNGTCDPVKEAAARILAAGAMEFMRGNRRAPLGAGHLAHFLEGSGLPIIWSGGFLFPGVTGPVSELPKLDPTFRAMRDALEGKLRNHVDMLLENNTPLISDTLLRFIRDTNPNPIEPSTGERSFRGFLIENAADPNLFFAFHGIERVNARAVESELVIANDKVIVPVIFTLEDTYKWVPEHLDQNHWAAAIAAEEMLWLQNNCTSVRIYTQTLEVRDELHVSLIDQLVIAPEDLTLYLTQSKQLVAKAIDKSGNELLIEPTDLAWAPSRLIDDSGLLNASLFEGTYVITATVKTNSAITARANLHVLPLPFDGLYQIARDNMITERVVVHHHSLEGTLYSAGKAVCGWTGQWAPAFYENAIQPHIGVITGSWSWIDESPSGPYPLSGHIYVNSTGDAMAIQWSSEVSSGARGKCGGHATKPLPKP